jgi:hypothetical protein
MKSRSLISTVTFLLLSTSLTQAQRSNMCTVTADQKFSLRFDVKPSLVVHDAAMDVTFGQAGVTGTPGEKLFSFSRTVGAVLQSAGGDNTPAGRAAFLQTMINTFDNNNTVPVDGPGGPVPVPVAFNQAASVLMPFSDRNGEAALNASDLLDESSAVGMTPLALFNRFDLAPEDWSHCGEYRIVYGKKNPAFQQRFLLIFEAMLPNPQFVPGNPAASEAGCRPVAELWAGLSNQADPVQRARTLSDFYYNGVGSLGPVVDFRNYGGDGGRGQVRGNIFQGGPWQLREWLTQATFNPTGNQLEFVVTTVKDNPLAELYRDDLTTETFA